MSHPQIILRFFPETAASERMEQKVLLPRNFPYFELKKLAEMLEKERVLVPGFIPPPAGLYVLDSFIYDIMFEKKNIILLPDRNIVTRMVKIAKGAPMDSMLRKTAILKAFCHFLDIQIEPSLAFHELAQAQGNVTANEELAWFRSADNADPYPWLHLALGTKDRIEPILQLPSFDSHDLDFPLRRWRRNYIVALKIAELELKGGTNLDRLLHLFNWMRDEFIVAGPAALLACIYFAPLSPPKAGLFKRLRSVNRDNALKGIKNAAWDLTHLSDFVRRVNETDNDSSRLLFASFDEGLTNLANLIFISSSERFEHEKIANAISAWWPSRHSIQIEEAIVALISSADDQNRKFRQSQASQTIDEMIIRGEESIVSFHGVAR